MLSCPTPEAAAQAAVREWAQRWGTSRVSLAIADEAGRMRLLALSDGGRPADASVAEPGLLAALGETWDQAASVCHPPATTSGDGSIETRVDDGVARDPIALAHAALVVSQGGAAAGVPLVADGVCIGALLVERRLGDGHPAHFTADELQTFEHLACLAAPLLQLQRRAADPAWRRALDGARRWWASREDARVRQRRRAMAAAAALVAIALGVPVADSVGGQARLEGAVQRVLSAGTAGFVQQVHARPGDVVRAGQPLLDLADRELQLEIARWQAQHSQQRDAGAAAQARGDRGQAAVHWAQADEAQAQLELASSRLERSRIVAPFDGVVVQGDWSQRLGEPVAEGAELMTIAPQDRLRIVVAVDERDIAAVHAGQRGSAVFSSLPWDSMALSVQRVSPVAHAVDGRNVFDVEAQPREDVAPAGLRPGLLGTARLDTGHAPLVWQWLRPAVERARLTVWGLARW